VFVSCQTVFLIIACLGHKSSLSLRKEINKNSKRYEKDLGEVGEYTLTVTNQSTGEHWSADNALILQTSTASGTYWVQIETEDGSTYYGTYTL